MNTLLESDNVIRFVDVTSEEGGNYVCSASNDAGTETMVATLTVTPPPLAVSVSPQALSVIEGQNALFRCSVQGLPSARVKWTRRGGSLPTTSEVRGALLALRPALEDDSGDYVCTAQHGSQTAENVVRLTVIGMCCVLLSVLIIIQ